MQYIKQHAIKFVIVIVAIILLLIILALNGNPQTSSAADISYETFKTDDIELSYPSWIEVDQSNVSEADRLALAVTDGKCAFVVKQTPLPDGFPYADFTAQRLSVAVQNSNAKIIAQQIGESSAFFEAELGAGGSVLRNISYDYLASSGMTYGIGFIAAKDRFEETCHPYIERVAKSVVVQ